MRPSVPTIRFALLVLGLVVLGGVAVMWGAAGRGALTGLVARGGAVGPVIAVFGFATLTLSMVPRTVLAFIGGVLFGLAAGAAYALAGALLGASLAFGAGRLLGRDFVASRASGRVAALDSWLGRRGLVGVIVVRLVPIAPYGLVSYAFGTSATRHRDFLVGSALGATPSTIAYAALGSAAFTANSTVLVASGAGLAALAVLSLAVAHYARRRGWLPSPSPS